MFTDYVLDISSAAYENRILIIDEENISKRTCYTEGFLALGFEIVDYQDDLSFRIAYEERVKNSEDKILIIAEPEQYIPYDLRKQFRITELSMKTLFPKLNASVLNEQKGLDLDLVADAYQNNFDSCHKPWQTINFLQQKVYGRDNVSEYLSVLLTQVFESAVDAENYRDWMKIAEQKAKIDVMATKFQVEADTSEINILFRDFVLARFGGLSSELDQETPVLVSRAMEYMHDHSSRFIVIVMDGMSWFDWEILSETFQDIPFKQSSVFAMIPSTTSVSRQCLLANKYPSQLLEPWKQSKEKQEYLKCAKNLGYSENQIGYARGYDADFSSSVCCGAIIINDVDDMVHAQHQGRNGMLSDVSILSDDGSLANTAKRFLCNGYDVYITADHGNTPCEGMGKLIGAGLEVETKSHRMVVLQNFADKESLLKKYDMIEYPKYYLSKEYDYLICNVGTSLDNKGENVITHGGISVDEVIVPFIQLKAVDANG